jgi:hypothetical protein
MSSWKNTAKSVLFGLVVAPVVPAPAKFCEKADGVFAAKLAYEVNVYCPLKKPGKKLKMRSRFTSRPALKS